MLDFSASAMVTIAAAAFLTGILHGMTGMAGGVVMAAILAHVIGIKAAVPVMTCALVLSHASRTTLYWRETDWPVAGRVLLFGCPTLVIGAVIFGFISARTVAVVFALFLISSFPIRYWARKHEIKTGPKLLAGASAVWGVLAGNVIGPGFFLAPFLLGTGMNRLAFVGTMAIITLVMNLLKLGVFGVTDLMTTELFGLGVAVGLITIPGNWLGKRLLIGMTDSHHGMIIDVLTILMIANFIYLAIVTPQV